MLREGRRRYPDLTSGHVVAAWLALDRGWQAEAESEFREALRLDPENIMALRGLADLLIHRGEEAKALEYLETLQREDPSDLDLPQRLRKLRALTESGQEIEPPPGPEPEERPWNEAEGLEERPWNEAEGPEEDVDLERAVLQSDASSHPPAEEPVHVLTDAPDPVVEDGEPIPSEEDLQGAVITPTLGEIFLRQGLFPQAARVFEALLERDPGNEHLESRLREVHDLQAQSGDSGDIPEGGPETKGDLAPGPETAFAGPQLHQAEVSEPLQAHEGKGFEGVVPIDSLAPDRMGARGTNEADLDAVPIQALAPEDVVSIDTLAPDEAVSIDALAPDGSVPIHRLAPDDFVSIDTLAPDEAVSIDTLAPDEKAGDSGSRMEAREGKGSDATLDDFERWLDDLE